MYPVHIFEMSINCDEVFGLESISNLSSLDVWTSVVREKGNGSNFIPAYLEVKGWKHHSWANNQEALQDYEDLGAKRKY